jgi:O-antigen/teichoic acid export membrane protein
LPSLNSSFEKLAKGAGLSFIGQVVSTGFKYFTQVILAWLLGVEFFGLYTLGLAIYQLAELVSRMGLEIGAVRYVAIYIDKNDERRLKGTLLLAISLPIISGLLVGVLLFLGASPIANQIFNAPELAPIVRVFAIAIPLGACVTVGAFATTGFQITNYRVYVWDILLPFINLLFAILLCQMGFGAEGAAFAWLVAVICTTGITFYFIYKLFPKVYRRYPKPIFEIRRLLSFSLPLSFGTLLWLVLIWTDILMLGYFRPPAEVGIYRAASQSAFLMILFTRSLVTIFSPMIASLYSKGNLAEISQVFQTAARWNFTLTLPLFLILTISSKDILQMFGAEFVPGWLPLVVLSVGQLTRSGAGNLAVHMLTMSGHQNLKLFGDLASAGVNIALNALLIPRWGAMGAAFATAISIAGVNSLQVFQVHRVLGVTAYGLSFLKPLTAGTAAFFCGLALQVWLGQLHFLLSATLTAVIVTLVYSVLLVGMKLEETDQILLNKIYSKMGFSRVNVD